MAYQPPKKPAPKATTSTTSRGDPPKTDQPSKKLADADPAASPSPTVPVSQRAGEDNPNVIHAKPEPTPDEKKAQDEYQKLEEEAITKTAALNKKLVADGSPNRMDYEIRNGEIVYRWVNVVPTRIATADELATVEQGSKNVWRAAIKEGKVDPGTSGPSTAPVGGTQAEQDKTASVRAADKAAVR